MTIQRGLASNLTLMELWHAIVRKILRYFPLVGFLAGWKRFRITKESALTGRRILRKFEPFLAVRAIWDGRTLINLSGEIISSIGFRRFSDIVLSLNRRGGMILDGRSIIVSENGLPGLPLVYFPNTSVAGIRWQHYENVYLDRPSVTEEVTFGIFAGSMAPHNWFHWIIDTLPTIYQARYLPSDYDEYPIILPRSVRSRKNWIDSLSCVLEKRPVHFVDDDGLVGVRHLLKLEPVTRPGPRPLHAEVTNRISVLPNPLLDYRDFIVKELDLEDTHLRFGRRIFLARKSTDLRAYNQEEALEVAEDFGFIPIYMQDLTFRESVEVFREAEIVIGPHGAGWANMLFSGPKSRHLLWTWGILNPDNWYQNIGLVSQGSYAELPHSAVSVGPGDPRSAGYSLDINVLRAWLENLDTTD